MRAAPAIILITALGYFIACAFSIHRLVVEKAILQDRITELEIEIYELRRNDNEKGH